MACAECIFPWGDARRYNSYSRHTREMFGVRVQKVAVSAGLTCPNRDGRVGTGGCTFCLNDAFTPAYADATKSITAQIDDGVAFHVRRAAADTRHFAYFQSFSNSYAPIDHLRALYDEAADHPAISGLVISTRPDCVSEEWLDLLDDYRQRGLHVAVEYGVESVHNQTLRLVNRAHDFECARRAIALTAERGIPVGAHLILGLPGESREMMVASAEVINSLPITSLKLHQLQIFAGTPMGNHYREHPEAFHLLALDDYIELLVDIVRRLRQDIVIERLASEVPPRYRINEGWGIAGHDRLIQLFEERLSHLGAHQGDLLNPKTTDTDE